MTKDQQYAYLFESWRKFVNEDEESFEKEQEQEQHSLAGKLESGANAQQIFDFLKNKPDYRFLKELPKEKANQLKTKIEQDIRAYKKNGDYSSLQDILASAAEAYQDLRFKEKPKSYPDIPNVPGVTPAPMSQLMKLLAGYAILSSLPILVNLIIDKIKNLSLTDLAVISAALATLMDPMIIPRLIDCISGGYMSSGIKKAGELYDKSREWLADFLPDFATPDGLRPDKQAKDPSKLVNDQLSEKVLIRIFECLGITSKEIIEEITKDKGILDQTKKVIKDLIELASSSPTASSSSSTIAGADLETGELKGSISTVDIGEGYSIQHNLTGDRKKTAEEYVQFMIEEGITNPYSLAGAMATMGKESNFKRKLAEGTWYSYQYLITKNKPGKPYKNRAVPNRVRAVFRHQLGREPNQQEWEQLSGDKGGRRGGIALFNIAYGYKSLGRKKRYTTYQLDEAIPHSLKVITSDGVINPKLFNPKLAGYKYRGRGPIQITFKENYVRTAKLANYPVSKITNNPDWLFEDPIRIVRMNAARTKGSYNKTKNTFSKHGMLSGGEPTNFREGIEFATLLAAGGGGTPNRKGHKHAISNAIKKANKHIRLIGPGSSEKEAQTNTGNPGVAKSDKISK